MISTDSLRIDSENIDKIINYLVPMDVIRVRKFMELCNYYQKFIKNLSKLLRLLRQLLKKDVKFYQESKEQKTFKKLKKILIKASVLLFPNFNKLFRLYTDTSLKRLEAVFE